MPKQRLQTTTLNSASGNTSKRHCDTTSKPNASSDNEDVIPIPIQIFLWRQSNPFIKRKFGNLTDASAISFDRVLVQNIVHGLSPSLSDAIASIPRWLLIKVAFPHVMHACSAAIEHSLHSIQQQPTTSGHPSLLVSSSISISPSASSQLQIPTSLQLPINTPNIPAPLGPLTSTTLSPTASVEHQSSQPPLFRLSSTAHSTSSYSSLTNKLSPSEIRLFHTLHYLILDSQNQNNNTSINSDQLLPLNTIQLFIYLFIPYIHTYLQSNEKEFLSHPDLAQGMRLIWQPLLEYRQPNIRMFSSFVKPIIPSYASPNENGDYITTINESQQQQQTFYINNNKRNRLSVLVESPTPVPTTKVILEESEEEQQQSQPSSPPPLPLPPSQPSSQTLTTNEHISQLPRSMSEKQPLSDLTNQPTMTAPIVSSEGSSISLFQPITAKKEQKSTSSVLVDSDTATTNNSITDLSAYGTSNGTKSRAPLVHMSSICSISDSSRLTTSPQSPAGDKFNILPGGTGSSSSSASTPSVLLPLNCSQCQQPVFAPNHPQNIPYICSSCTPIKPTPTPRVSDLPLKLEVQKDLISITRRQSIITPKPRTSQRSSELLLLATYFDIGILRTLFSPSWLTDGYLWCLEYLHKRIIDISDEILSDALMNGTLPINILRFKSLSIPQLNLSNEQDYYEYLKNIYFNEQVTNDIIEQQCMMAGTGDMATSTSTKQPATLLNVPFKYFAGKSPYNGKHSQKYDNFYKKISKIRYIDEEGIEHLDLANVDRRDNIQTLSSKTNRLHLTDPGLLLLKTTTINVSDRSLLPATTTVGTARQSVDSLLITSNPSATKITTTIPTTNLNLMKTYSVSDSEINYKFLEEIEEAQGSSAYINRSGTINFGVVLAGIHAVICKEHHLKVCELVMNILDVLLGLAVISSSEDDLHKKQLLTVGNTGPTSDDRGDEQIEEWLKQIDAKEEEKFQLAVDITLRIIKRLGCPHCQPRGRSFTADQLRGKVRLSLNKLRILNQHRFEKYFLNLTLNGDLVHILDIFHALCGYCSESNVGLAHYSPYIPTKVDAHLRQTYSNNFGNTHLGVGPKGIDGFILNIVFKPFVTRLIMMKEYLLGSENVALYGECRAFLTCIKENHGGIFRLVVFSSLLDPEKRLKTLKQQEINIKPKTKISHTFIRQDPVNSNGKGVFLNRDLSDDADLDRHGSTSQPLTTYGTDDAPVTNTTSSTFSIKLKSARARTGSLMGGDDHSLYTHQEESLYVDLSLIRFGLLRLNFLMESCPPGSLPDPQFLNSLLILDSPVISKAAFLVECAYFVRRCSLGQWPEWMRINMTTFRPHESFAVRATGNMNARLNKLYQAAAARMFYIWGEALSSQLETILNNEQQQQQQQTTTDHTNETGLGLEGGGAGGGTNFWNSDETYEDYYNEAIVNRSGHDCPYSLRVMACLLLYEITSFLREVYDTLPKLSSLPQTGVNIRQQQQQQRTNNQATSAPTTLVETASTLTDKRSTDRMRMGSVVSQISNRSSASISSEHPALSPQASSATIPPVLSTIPATIININPTLAGERHISFAVNKENDSNESNHTAVMINDDDGVVVVDGNSTPVVNDRRMSVAAYKSGSVTGSTGKSKLIRRSSVKLRKPSLRMKDTGKNNRRSSYRTRRRSHASNISSETDGHQSNIGSSAMEPTDEYLNGNDEDFDQGNFDDIINTRPFPWIKVVIRILNDVNLTCEHQIKCVSNCYDKQTTSCKNLIQALLNMYRLSSLNLPNIGSSFSRSSSSTHRSTTHLKRNDTTSSKSQQDPKKRRLSTCLFGESTGQNNDNTTKGVNTNKTTDGLTYGMIFESADPHFDPHINTHFTAITAYLEKQVGTLTQVPLMILCKSSVLLEDEHYSQVLHLSWELLLDRNEELSACAATIVILTAARANHLVDTLFHTEMENSSALIRYNAILKFQTLWRFRYQFWIRLEEGAHSMMKILPPSIEFVLPSPALGISNLQTVDPPWMPHAKTLVQQVALNQEEVRAVVTASKTRKKHQQELIHSALMAEETSKRVARENFAMSTVPMLQSASFEPLLHQPRDEEEEGHSDDDRFVETSIQIRQAQGTFPSAFGAAVYLLVEMLEDEETLENGATVSEAARKALWTCLVDEPTLLIRFFFEKLSHKERRIKSLQSLRRLMICLTDIPPQFAHAVFNYVLGLLMSMVRSPLDGSQELIVAGLTLLWQIIPYLHGLVLKDLKQILRKEQAEMMILITGNIPSTKKVIIHGPDLSQIPTQAIIQEDTQFSNVLQEALDFFGIPDSKRDRYYLIDVKTQQIHIPDTYVRDFYFFRRNIYPQLSLIHMDTKQSQKQLEQMSIYLKTTELSKVLFARYLVENTPYNQIHNCVTFFHDELIKSPSFPRKPLESDFNLYTRISDKELFNLDMLHKYNWIKLIASLFFNMDGKTTTTWDITLFLNVINGGFILHCEDFAMLRFCLAIYISTAKHFRHIFATNGYLLIMPTFLRVYSNIQSNPMLKRAIEYCCRQFFILHRIPFILQMLGSISQLLDFDEQADVTDTNKIQPINLFRLLIALEQTTVDAMRDDYSILELVKDDSSSNKTTSIITPTTMPIANMTVVAALGQGNMIAPSTIKTLDFCYADDDTIFTLLNCIDVCVTVVAYAPDSIRSLQMLGIIDLLLPKYLEYLKDRTNKNDTQKYGREEIKIIEKLSVAIKTMISASESLTRTFVGPKHETLTGASYKHSRGSNRSPSIVPDEDSMSRFIDDRTKNKAQDGDEHKQASEFRWPRDTLLSVISTFIHFSTQRLKELTKLINDPTLRMPELLDAKSHTRLADIAHTLLKLGGYDPITMSCRGIQNYFQKLLPWTNWSQEQLRPALNLLLRRIDRMFSKICKKPLTKRCFDWEATAGILNGIYLTIDRHPYIAYFPNLKALVSGCIALVLNENVSESSHSVPRFDTAAFPKEFSRVVIKLVGRYLLAIKNQPNLEALTGNSWSSSNVPSSINHLLHFFLPLMFWAGSGRKDAPKLHSIDISYIIFILLNALKPISKLATAMAAQGGPGSGAGGQISSGPSAGGGKQHLTIGEAILQNSSFTHKSMRQLKDLLQTASLLGLKVLIIGFSKQLKREWRRIAQSIKLMCNKQSNVSSILLSFIDFIVSYKTPIFVILRPFLFHYIYSISSDNDRDYEMITNIQQKLIFDKITPAKSTGEILNGLMQELNHLKAELTAVLITTTQEMSRTSSAGGKKRIILSRTPRRRKRDDIPLVRLSSSDESKSLFPYETRPVGTEKVRFDTEALEQMKDRDGGTGTSAATTDGRSAGSRLTNTYRIRQQQSSDSSLNASPKKKTEKIRAKEALDILETYLARYRIRSGAEIADIPIKWTRDLTLNHPLATTDEPTTPILSESSPLQSSSNQNQPSQLSRSITVAGDRSPSTNDRLTRHYNRLEETDIDQSTTTKEGAHKLRTFRGRKRDTAHFDKSRLTKGLMRSHISSEPVMTYDATKEMNDIFRPSRQANKQDLTSVTNEKTSDFIDTRASNDQSVLASFFNNNINEQIPSSSSIPMTTILPMQTESHTEVWISRLPNTPPVTEADYESQV
ncbi:unnamed protein product [Rotaria sordida]|uniref:Uncharacterized protein n=1 Tax=Rotaria sordida TaxID=392033 RepID=A0A818MXB5_9BILA|nr:unnamed protein product [Rotaria sordida]CAF3596736.1 unnamed protein product [Rotaria sordida]